MGDLDNKTTLTRRDFLRAGALGMGAWSLADLARYKRLARPRRLAASFSSSSAVPASWTLGT